MRMPSEPSFGVLYSSQLPRTAAGETLAHEQRQVDAVLAGTVWLSLALSAASAVRGRSRC